VGVGYDSHRFGEGGPMRLGGVDLPAEFHCAGHSDGDAVCHAITDAILGACALGDIGAMFPDTDPANKGKDSVMMLEAAVSRVWDAGYAVGNVDITVVTEWPKVGPHRDAMRARLASALRTSAERVFIKGKTNERMGWIGRGEGLAVLCTATLVAR
jgi:2-C-methyl-D-erythritol 2,4-cyclodiphosphate synthase